MSDVDGPPVALVTGAGSGIGAASAVLLAERGWRVALCGRRVAPLEVVAQAAGGLVVAGDVTEPGHADRTVAAVLEAFGRLDALVLNAGITTVGTVETTAPEDWARTLAVNLTAPYLLARAAMPALRERGGAIVTVGSVSALRAAPESAAYAASKAGIVMLTQSMALDHGPEGVRCNCVCPGWTRSEMSDGEMAELAQVRGGSVEDAYAAATAYVPLRRPADAREVAAAIAWLLGDESSYVNGAVLTVDGGTSIVDIGTVAFGPAPGV